MFRRVLLSCVLWVGCKSTVPSADSMSPLTGPAPTPSVELAFGADHVEPGSRLAQNDE
jgi:hypothetical protein